MDFELKHFGKVAKASSNDVRLSLIWKIDSRKLCHLVE